MNGSLRAVSGLHRWFWHRRAWKRYTTDLEREVDYLRTRMLVAVSFLSSEKLDEFHHHVHDLDHKHRRRS